VKSTARQWAVRRKMTQTLIERTLPPIGGLLFNSLTMNRVEEDPPRTWFNSLGGFSFDQDFLRLAGFSGAESQESIILSFNFVRMRKLIIQRTGQIALLDEASVNSPFLPSSSYLPRHLLHNHHAHRCCLSCLLYPRVTRA